MSDTFTVSGQIPADLDPLSIPAPLASDPNNPGSDYDFVNMLTDPIDDAWFQPLKQNTPASVTHHQGLKSTAIDARGVAEIINTALDPDNSSAINHTTARKITSQLSVHASVNHNQPINRLFFSQSLGRTKSPAPAAGSVIYTIDNDVVPAAKSLLGDQSSLMWDKFNVALTATFGPPILGIGVLSSDEFSDFQSHLHSIASSLGSHVNTDVATKLRKFNQLSLDGLTEAQLLRNDDKDHTDDYSFARILVYAVYDWLRTIRAASQSGQVSASLLPFDLQQVLMPEAIVFVNVDAHAHAPSKTIHAEWSLINDALNMVQPPISLRKLTKLTAAPTNMHKVAAMAVRADRKNRDDPANRQAPPLVTKQPPPVAIGRDISRVLSAMGRVRQSQNTYISKTYTRSKPSKRRPDSVDSRGKRRTRNYHPDIHFYMDCSGSMSEENHIGVIRMIAEIAAKLGVNLYVTSFSHFLSEDALIPGKNRSASQITEMIRNLPKVGGGTNFEIVWNHISQSPERSTRMNIIATDFEFSPHWGAKHSDNTFYAPCDMGNWDALRHHIKRFTREMQSLDPTIPERILGVY